MHQFLKKSLAIACSLALLVCFEPRTSAYVLPGPYILELMTQNLGKAKRLLVSQNLLLKDENPLNKSVELGETLKYIFPKTFRSDITSENIHKIHVLSKGRVLTLIDGKVSSEPESRYDHYKDLLLYRSREMLQNRLASMGVDVKVSSFGRFHGKPVYVLGAQYPDETAPQIWLDKETFRPFRWIMTGKSEENPDNGLEVWYSQWHQVNKTWYPMRIEFIEDGTLVRKIDVKHIKVNPSFPKRLFDIGHLEARHTQPASVRPDQDKKEEMNEIQKTIEEFKKIYK